MVPAGCQRVVAAMGAAAPDRGDRAARRARRHRARVARRRLVDLAARRRRAVAGERLCAAVEAGPMTSTRERRHDRETNEEGRSVTTGPTHTEADPRRWKALGVLALIQF